MTTLVTANPRPRCRFGRPHIWFFGPWYEQGVGWVADGEHVKCSTCGQVEYDG